MQKNTVELMDEVEQDLTTEIPTKEEPKQYEKLLLAASNVEAYKKATNLIKLGCFEQKQETKIDFSGYELVDSGKKYKGRYKLYRNLDTMQLTFIQELVENNKNDENERLDLAPYAYDVLYVENVDAEAYEILMASKKNLFFDWVKFGYVTSIVLYFVSLVAFFAAFLYNIIITSISSGFSSGLLSAVAYSGSPLAVSFAMTPLIVLMMIKYKKYKGQ